MRRRELLASMTGALAAPALVLAQPARQLVIGFLSTRSQTTERDLAPFRRGLAEAGFTEGRNLAVEYRYAHGDFSRLPALAAELVALRVQLIVTVGGPLGVRAVRSVSADLPVVFASGSDPVAGGLVTSFGRPGGKTTGVHTLTVHFGPKRLELLREIVPQAREIAFLVNPNSATTPLQIVDIENAVRGAHFHVFMITAGRPDELDAALAQIAARGAGALLMSADTFFQVHRDRLVTLVNRFRIPTMFEWPEFVRAGGLISYSPMIDDAWRQMGAYAGRILSGEQPENLPVYETTRTELLLNLRTARDQRIDLPQSIILRTDEVIE